MTNLRVLPTTPARPSEPAVCYECRFLASRDDAPAYWRCAARGGAYASTVNYDGACRSWVQRPPAPPVVVKAYAPISPLWTMVAIFLGAAVGLLFGVLVLR